MNYGYSSCADHDGLLYEIDDDSCEHGASGGATGGGDDDGGGGGCGQCWYCDAAGERRRQAHHRNHRLEQHPRLLHLYDFATPSSWNLP